MHRSVFRAVPGVLIAALIVAIPLLYVRVRDKHLRNFRVVEERVLYRSAQLSPAGLERVIHDYGIRTVVSFRYPDNEGDDPPDKWEEAVCARLGVSYVRIRPKIWVPDEKGVIPAEAGVERFLSIVRDPKAQPVLVHCYKGVHRTGSYCAIFRMECQGWSNADALEELRRMGYDNLDKEDDVRGYLESYVPSQRDSKPKR